MEVVVGVGTLENFHSYDRDMRHAYVKTCGISPEADDVAK